MKLPIKRVTTILLVGLGSIGQRHARIINRSFPSVSLIVLRHRSCEKQPDPTLGIHQCVTTLEAALAFQPEIAIIASPAPNHLEVALPLAHAGIHLLIEKPLSHTLEGVPELIQLARKSGCVIMVGYNLRFLPSLIRFRDLLSQRIIGEVLSVRAEIGQYLPDWRPETDYRKNVSAQSSLGGGVLLELSHELDYLLWLFGPAIWVEAFLARQSQLEIDVEDTAHLLLGFQKQENDRQLVATVALDCIRQDTTRRCMVIGEQGSLEWNAIEGTVSLYRQNSADWQLLFSDKPDRDYTYRKELTHFMRCIETQSQPLIDAHDGFSVLKIVDAARCSAEKHERVLLDRGNS